MKQFFFFIGFIWPLVSIGSLLLAPLVGIDRTKLKRELADLWNAKKSSTLAIVVRRTALVFSWAGFLLPVIFPLRGLVVGAIFFTLFALA